VLAYPIELTPDDNGTLLATCPELPEVTTFGRDERDALEHAADAVTEALASRIAAGEPVPLPPQATHHATVALPVMIAAKVELYRAMAEAGVPAGLLAERLGRMPDAVAALLDLDRASPLPQLEAAFRAIGKRLDLVVRDAA
jgi:antitoxin HicB